MSNHEAYLRTSLAKYQYPDMAKRDILSAFQTYKDLRPHMDGFVFNDGQSKQLLCLDGTIPVSYKGGTYNIPVCLWLMDTHPYNPPMAYVKPTATMQIKPGRHVDSNGRVYLPYLHEWKHPQSDLLGLIQVLCIVFGDEPPVFSKNSAPQRPPPPTPYSGSSTNLPYPAAGSGMPMPSVGAAGGYPPSTGYRPPTSYPNTSYPNYPGYPPTTYPNQSGYGYTGYPPQQATAVQSSGTTTTASTNAGVSLSDEQIRLSLLSAVEDKMRRRLREIFAQSQAELDALKKTEDDLQRGKGTLEEMLQKLEREQNDVETNLALLKEKNQELESVLAKLESQEKIDVDDAVSPTAPLYKQLLQAFAEEQATEDAIYYLGEALRREVIDLDTYLKQVRELSRKQFMLGAVVKKCRQKAGLPEMGRA